MAVRKVPGWIRAIPILAATVVGASSFILSFNALRELSVRLGAVPEHLSYLLPIAIDGGVLAGSAAIWAASVRGAKKDWIAYFTTASLLGLSVVCNVQHAAPDALGRTLAGSPPLILLLCLELIASQARRDSVEDVTVPEPQHTTLTAALVPGEATRTPALTALASVTPAPASAPGPVESPVRPAKERPAAVRGPAAAELAPGPAVGFRTSAPVAVPAAKPAAVRARTTTTPDTERIKAAFDAHLRSGGDPKDQTLAARMSQELDIPIPSVRRALGRLRRPEQA